MGITTFKTSLQGSKRSSDPYKKEFIEIEDPLIAAEKQCPKSDLEFKKCE